ncbi:MAG: helix-turn-helix transcriptional regulator [Myxococcota bacterium]
MSIRSRSRRPANDIDPVVDLVHPAGWSVEEGRELRQMRTDAGLTQDGLAEMLSVSRAHVSRVESATNGPSARVLRAWYSACGYTLTATAESESEVSLRQALYGMRDDELMMVARFARFWRRIPTDLRRAWARFMDAYDEQ